MKNKKYIFTFSILIIIISILVIYFSHDLSLRSISGLGRHNLDRTYYLSYNAQKEGVLNPVIEDIVLLRKDGTPYNRNDYDIIYEFYIDRKNHTGVIDDLELKNNSSFYDYVPAKDYKIINNEFQIVLGVRFKNNNYNNDLKGMKVTYRILFIKKVKLLEINSLVR